MIQISWTSVQNEKYVLNISEPDPFCSTGLHMQKLACEVCGYHDSEY